MATGPDAVLRELDGLRALARALVAGGEDADDLLQNTALAALEYPPDVDRPVRPWLAAVLRNRRRMDRRAESRRQRRDLAAVPDETIQPDDPADPIDRARTLERLSTALVALDEPFRTAVIRRYLDDESAADIARALGVPAGTVRWRVKTGIDRLRAALDEKSPRWRHAVLLFAPTLAKKGPLLVKVKTSLVFAALLLLCIGAGVWLKKDRSPASSAAASRSAAIPKPNLAAVADDAGVPVVDPLPGQGRVRVVADPVPGGLVGGRVINWSGGDGVAGAELTFTGDSGAVTIRSRADGTFELAPPSPGAFTLTAAAAPGFLPYAPEYQHSTVHLVLAKDRAVRGLTVFLFPALDYRGRVIDAAGAPVKLVVSAGGTLRGAVVDATTGGPIAYARVMREARGGGASIEPANAGTVTRADGTFELTGLPAGPLAITIGADSYHPRIEGGLTATDGDTLGPISIALTRLADGEQPTLELVGIGVKLAPDADTLRVDLVIPNSGAAAAGIVVGDRVVAVDGVPTSDLGVDGAVSKIRGVEGTTVAITLKRGDAITTLAITRHKLKA